MVQTCICLVCPQGFDLELVGAVSSAVTIPVIASSGAGTPEHFSQVCALFLRIGLRVQFIQSREKMSTFMKVFNSTRASAALAAGIFHRREVAIMQVKTHMEDANIPTRV